MMNLVGWGADARNFGGNRVFFGVRGAKLSRKLNPGMILHTSYGIHWKTKNLCFPIDVL